MGISRTKNLASREAIFKFIRSYKCSHDGNSPSLREIMEMCGISSTSVVHYHLDILEQEGRIRLKGFKIRQIEVVGGEWVWHEEISV